MFVKCSFNDNKKDIKVLTSWSRHQAKGVVFWFELNVAVVEIVVWNAEVSEVEPRDYSTKTSGSPPAKVLSSLCSLLLCSALQSIAMMFIAS